MRARLTIEYEEDLRGDGQISIYAEAEPERVELREIDILGILEAAKHYVMRED